MGALASGEPVLRFRAEPTIQTAKGKLVRWRGGGIEVAGLDGQFRLDSARVGPCAVVVRAVRLGFIVVAVPVRLGFADGRHTSHYRPVVDSCRIAGAVTRARLEALGWATRRS